MSKNEEHNKSTKIGRRFTREELFKLIFSSDMLNEDLRETFDSYLKRDERITTEKEIQFLKTYIEGISENILLIKNEISKNMENWNLMRIGNVERSLLILSTYEILKEDIPTEIVVNEAIELAKEYGDTKTYEFINGVLAKIIESNKK